MHADLELGRLRAAMDVCNRRLAEVLHERARLARRIGAWKRAHGKEPVDAPREAEMLAQMRGMGHGAGFGADELERIFAAVLAESRQVVERG